MWNKLISLCKEINEKWKILEMYNYHTFVFFSPFEDICFDFFSIICSYITSMSLNKLYIFIIIWDIVYNVAAEQEAYLYFRLKHWIDCNMIIILSQNMAIPKTNNCIMLTTRHIWNSRSLWSGRVHNLHTVFIEIKYIIICPWYNQSNISRTLQVNDATNKLVKAPVKVYQPDVLQNKCRDKGLFIQILNNIKSTPDIIWYWFENLKNETHETVMIKLDQDLNCTLFITITLSSQSFHIEKKPRNLYQFLEKFCSGTTSITQQ